MTGPWEKFGGAAPAPGPWDKFAQAEPAPVQVDTRSEIDRWADEQVAKERAAGFKQLPRAAEGIPIVGGFLDEATAGIQSVLSTVTGGRVGETYERALALERARSRAADEANPALATTSKLVTGLATGGAVMPAVTPAATLAGRVGQGVVIGAPAGFVEGFTRGEGDFGNRVDAGADAAKAGGVIGGVLPVAAAGVSRAYGAAADAVAPTITRLRSGPAEAADDILARRMGREGSSPAQKRLDLQEGQTAARLNSNSQATLPETIADTSDAMQRLTGSVYRAGGEAGNDVRQALETRQRGPANPYGPRTATAPEGQRARVLDTATRTMLIRTSDTARQTERRIMMDQAREGRRLYGEAYNRPEAFDLDPAIRIMELKIQQYPGPFAAKLQRAVNLFRMSGAGNNRPFWVDDIRRFDGAKKVLDDEIEKAVRGGAGNLSRELTEFKQDLLNAVHAPDAAGNPTRNLVYHEARRTWGSAAENREAIELGRSALREGSEISAEAYRDLTPGQQQLFRIGFLESLRNSMGRTRPGNDATLLFQEPRVQELMNEIIPRSNGRAAVFANRPQRFGEVMRREGRMVQTRNAVLGNSSTAQRQQDDAEFTGDTLRSMWDRFRSAPSLFNMGVEAVGSGIQAIFGYRQDVARELAQRLLTTDRTLQNQILRRLQRRAGPDVFQRFADHVDRTALQITQSGVPALVDVNEGGTR